MNHASPISVLFLDFDGVLNSHRFMLASGRPVAPVEIVEDEGVLGLDAEAVARLNRIVERTGAEVVVTSTWRKSRSVPDLQRVLDAEGFQGKVRGKTPDCVLVGLAVPKHGVRGDEIQSWLSDAPRYGIEVGSFVILDDDADMSHLAHRLVKTTMARGLLDEHVDRVVEMFQSAPSLVSAPSIADVARFGR
jgi:hypothetical protein